MLETLDHTIRIGSTPTFLYFDLKPDLACVRTLVSANNHRKPASARRLNLTMLIPQCHGKFKEHSLC